MKKLSLSGIIIILILTSCSKNDKEIFLKIGNDLEYEYSDIDLYDSSTHVLYFKTIHDELKSMENNSFVFLNDGDEVFSGAFCPGYSSFRPYGPFIYTAPFLYGSYALRIENGSRDKPDVRNDPGMIASLKKRDLLHSGLSVGINSVEKNGTQLSFKFTVTNNDQSDLLILDPEKTGLNLFHYFSNGLSLFDVAGNEIFSGNIQPQSPDPWDSWSTDWLSRLKSGESKEFMISYSFQNPLNPGEYRASFAFPGLEYQVTKDQLYQDNSRIWLGDKRVNKKIIIP
jgi:hypothetical protein